MDDDEERLEVEGERSEEKTRCPDRLAVSQKPAKTRSAVVTIAFIANYCQ
jgi:hypothetical protein